jgi:hypothetical protein
MCMSKCKQKYCKIECVSQVTIKVLQNITKCMSKTSVERELQKYVKYIIKYVTAHRVPGVGEFAISVLQLIK